MDDAPDAVDELDALDARREARKRILRRAALAVAVVGTAFVGLQWLVGRQLRRDAAEQGLDAIEAYVTGLGGASIAQTLQQRYLAAAVRTWGQVELSEAAGACGELDDALDVLTEDDLDLVACEVLVQYGHCHAPSGRGSAAVDRHVSHLRQCAAALAGIAGRSSPEIPAGELEPAPAPLTLPRLPPGDELYGRVQWYPMQDGPVAAVWLRNEDRCTETPDTEALDCIRPATFLVDGNDVSELVYFPLPNGLRAWRATGVTSDGSFVALARGPGKEELLAHPRRGDPRRVTLPWGDDIEAERDEPPWASEARHALDRKPPPRVDAARTRTPDEHNSVTLEDGALVSVHPVSGETLVFVRRELMGPTLYRDLGPAPDRVALTATPDGALVVSGELNDEPQFLWSRDGGRSWIGASPHVRAERPGDDSE